MIRYECTKCGTSLVSHPAIAGRKAKCTVCGRMCVVPPPSGPDRTPGSYALPTPYEENAHACSAHATFFFRWCVMASRGWYQDS